MGRFLAIAALAGAILAVPAQAAPLRVPQLTSSTTCPNSDTMTTGTNAGAWYTTVAPSEHFDSGRSQVFAGACNLTQITNSAGPYTMITRVAPGSYPNAYNIATRDAGELFIYGGYTGQGGSYVAKLDPDSLAELWRTKVVLPSTQWSFLGAMGVLGNGNVYSIQGNVLAKINPATGQQQLLVLPQLTASGGGTGAAYNGFVVNPDGLIFAKSMERGPCASDTTQAVNCVIRNGLPSTVVVVNPVTMTILASIKTAEPSLGRIMSERHNGIDYIYIPGVSKLVRYQYYGGVLSLDTAWGPVGYGNGANAGGVGLMGSYAVVQTNYVPSMTPSYVIAANINDGTQQYLSQPFGKISALSWVPSKGALDTQNNRIYVQDTYAGQIAMLTIGSSGLQTLWKVNDTATGFMALVGLPAARQLVVPNSASGYDTMDWRSIGSGGLQAQTSILTTAANATISVNEPGFKGRFYYPSFYTGQLLELTAAASP